MSFPEVGTSPSGNASPRTPLYAASFAFRRAAHLFPAPPSLSRTGYGPLTVNTSLPESFLPSEVQIAPWAVQSEVMGNTMITSELEAGVTVISQRTLLGAASRRALSTVPPRHCQSVLVQRRVAEVLDVLAQPQLEGERGAPSCDDGLSWTAAVRGGLATAVVAALVRLSALPASSVKATVTVMTLPSSAATRV